mmetsp:Transcript_18711/g.40513  ORF Transcript_18711/g.40513 Transcript_18711/m.40513 type:complete len:297 (-) Transcript_18711:136-1026(-)
MGTVSKILWFGLVLAHVLHAGVMMYTSEGFMEQLWGTTDKAYLGDTNCAQIVFFVMKLMAVNELLLALSLFFMGDTKYAFTCVMIYHAVTLATQPRDVALWGDLKGMTETHVQSGAISLIAMKVFLGLNLVGLVTAGRKKDNIRRSTSLTVHIILVGLCAGEFALNSLILMDLGSVLKLALPHLPVGKCTEVSIALFPMFGAHMGAAMLATVAVLHTLKPTHIALSLFAMLHAGKLFLAYDALKTAESTKGTNSHLVKAYENVMIPHAVGLAISLVAASIALVSKTELSSPHQKTE